MTPPIVIFIYMLVAFGCGIFVAYRFLVGGNAAFSLQNQGEVEVTRALQSNFAAPDYHLLNHVTLRLPDGTTQIDHILVSRFGIFVIETKTYKGWIFASEQQKEWTQVLFRAKFRFQNPLLQNYRHVCAVRAQLDFLPLEAVRSVVVFTGSAEFKTGTPRNVFSLPALVEYLRLQRTEVMSLNRMHFCIGRLEAARLEISRRTDIQHQRALQRKFGLRS